MHRVEKLEQLLAQASARGYVVRQAWLGGRGGGACEIAGKKHLFVDLALNVTEQLAQVSEALRGELVDTAAVGKRKAA
jgi:hypothetical protein